MREPGAAGPLGQRPLDRAAVHTRGVRLGRDYCSLVREPKRQEATMKNLIRRFIRDEEGQDIIEYALLAAFISIIAIAAVRAVGGRVQVYFGNVQSALS